MPNWCEGTLKIRGRVENILTFLKEGLGGTARLDGSTRAIRYEEEEGYLYLMAEWGFHIRGTDRHFIESENLEFYFDGESNESEIYCMENFKAAWKIKAEELREISEKYKVDIKIYGFESGMEFNQDIEIIGGTIVKDEKITFTSYDWECPMPNLGG